VLSDPPTTSTDRIVVALVTDALAPFNKGGKEVRHHALSQRMSGHAVDVDVYTMRWWAGPRSSAQGPVGLHAISPFVPLYAGSRRSIRQALVFSLACFRMLTKRFDVLEGDAIPFLPLFPLRVVATLRRKPLVVTWHEVWGPAYWRDYLGRLGVVAAWCERLAVSLPDHIIAASEGTAERLGEISRGKARITVVPNGVDADEIAAAPPAPGTVDLLCVGRLLVHKKVDVVIDAVARLRDQGRAVSLTVIGEGPEQAALEAQVQRLGLAGQVNLVGALEERLEVLAAMKSASVLAFPSEREGFGMVALEALACGTPVVTSDHADNFARSLVVADVNGHAVPATVDAMTVALGAALDDVDRLSAGALEAAGEYSWDALAAQVAKVYRS
jgi:glycosyltransferase involved in cell wall biosynthesis